MAEKMSKGGMTKVVGDGTGMGSMPPTYEGDLHQELGDEPERVAGIYDGSVGGSKHPSHDGPQRTSHPHGSGKSGSD